MKNERLGYSLLERDLEANPDLDAFRIGELLETVISPLDTHFPWGERKSMLNVKVAARRELLAALPNAQRIINCLR